MPDVERQFRETGGWNRYHIDSLTLGLVAQRSPERLLDLGCANGRFGRAIGAPHTIGVEIDPDLASEASRFYEQVFVGDAAAQDVQRSVEQEGPFDLVLATDFIEHIGRPVPMLKWCTTVLRPEGCLVIGVPNLVYWRERVALGRGRFDTTPAGGLYDATHLHFFSAREFRRLLADGGFEIERFVAAPRTRRGEQLAHLPSVVMRGYETMVGRPAFRLAQLRPGLWGSSFLAVAVPA